MQFEFKTCMDKFNLYNYQMEYLIEQNKTFHIERVTTIRGKHLVEGCNFYISATHYH